MTIISILLLLSIIFDFSYFLDIKYIQNKKKKVRTQKMKAVLIVGNPESDEVKALSVFLPEQKCSYQVYNENSILVPEHIGAMVFLEKSENMQELIDICQKYSINFISKFGFGGFKIPQTLNYSMRVLKEEQISCSFIFSLLNEMNELNVKSA